MSRVFSDWVAGAKWEARQQGTSLRQWQDSGSWLRPSLRTSHHIIVHSWKRNPVQSLLPNSNTFLAFKLFWSTRKLPLCHIQHHNCARKEGPPSPHKQSTILNPQSTIHITIHVLTKDISARACMWWFNLREEEIDSLLGFSILLVWWNNFG